MSARVEPTAPARVILYLLAALKRKRLEPSRGRIIFRAGCRGGRARGRSIRCVRRQISARAPPGCSRGRCAGSVFVCPPDGAAFPTQRPVSGHFDWGASARLPVLLQIPEKSALLVGLNYLIIQKGRRVSGGGVSREPLVYLNYLIIWTT